MKKWIKNLGYFLLAIGIVGVIGNRNWITLEERITQIVFIVFILIGSGISLIEWLQGRKSKVSKS